MFHLMCSKMHALSEILQGLLAMIVYCLASIILSLLTKRKKKKRSKIIIYYWEVTVQVNSTTVCYMVHHFGPKKMQKRVQLGEKKKRDCFCPGSNRGPCACEAHVITATPRKHLWFVLPISWILYSPPFLQLTEKSDSDLPFDFHITGTR